VKGRVGHLKRAVQGLHSGVATFERFEHLAERHEGSVVWEGDVAVFSLSGHPVASIAYAWAEPVGDSGVRRFFAVLHQGPVTSARLALRASFLDDSRDDRSPDTGRQ
jgi:hypothetical protein